jgi:hypothetical protein
MPQHVSELDVGTYHLAIAEALAQDLAARAVGWDPDTYTYAEGTLRVLVPRYGPAILHGLKPDLPAWLRAGITSAVHELEEAAAASSRPDAAGPAADGPGTQLPGTAPDPGGAPSRADEARGTSAGPPTTPPAAVRPDQGEAEQGVGPEGSQPVFEFRYVEAVEARSRAAPTPSPVAARLQRLADVAATLANAGWRTWFTATGLAFEPTGGIWEEDDVVRRLEELGIAERFSPEVGRTPGEVLAAHDELEARVWYERKLVMLCEPGLDLEAEIRRAPRFYPAVLEAMRQVEGRYGATRLGATDDFDWGLTNGKLSALRWVTGDAWDDLET